VIEARAVPFLGGPAVVVGSEKIAKEKNGEFPKASTDGPEYFASCFLELLDGGLGAFRSGAGKGTASKNLGELMPMPVASGRSPATKSSSSSGRTPIPIFRFTGKPKPNTRGCNTETSIPFEQCRADDGQTGSNLQNDRSRHYFRLADDPTRTGLSVTTTPFCGYHESAYRKPACSPGAS
jgi:hypothetical protein